MNSRRGSRLRQTTTDTHGQSYLGLQIRGLRWRDREPSWESDRTADFRTTMDAHGAPTLVLGVKVDPPDQPERLVDNYGSEGWGVPNPLDARLSGPVDKKVEDVAHPIDHHPLALLRLPLRLSGAE